jgi:hypothetical protein
MYSKTPFSSFDFATPKADHTTLAHGLPTPLMLSPSTSLRYAQDRLRP